MHPLLHCGLAAQLLVYLLFDLTNCAEIRIFGTGRAGGCYFLPIPAGDANIVANGSHLLTGWPFCPADVAPLFNLYLLASVFHCSHLSLAYT